jgi:hypothetical protein
LSPSEFCSPGLFSFSLKKAFALQVPCGNFGHRKKRDNKPTTTMKITTTRRFAWITNNAYDTLAIVIGDKVAAAWTITETVAQEYLDTTGDEIDDWDLNWPERADLADYGDEVTGDELQDRINFFVR